MTATRVSVVLCAAGNGDDLAEQLAALAQQITHEPWEFIFVDNGCTPTCLATVQAMLEQLPDARILTAKERPGPSYGRNAGVAAARGDLVVFCDDDDVVTPGWLQALCDALAQHQLVGGALDVESLNDPALLAWRDPLQSEALPTMHGHLPYAMSSNMGVHRDVFQKLGGFDEQLYPGEDVDFSWRLQYAGDSIGFARDALLRYRYRPDLRRFLRQRAAYGRVSAILLLKHRDMGLAHTPMSKQLWQVVIIAAGVRKLRRADARRNRWLGIAAYWWGEKWTLLVSAVHRRPSDVRLRR